MNAGLAASDAAPKAALFERALASLGVRAAEAHAWWVPGRIEFLGKHTDYGGGRSLLCACERGVAVVALSRADTRVRVRDAIDNEEAAGELRPDLGVPANHWSNYPLTVVRRVARNFPALHGADIAFASELPRDAGLSSSSALVVATWLAIADLNELAIRDEYQRSIRSADDLAEYLGAVENGKSFRDLTGDRGVGTQGGSQDHTAILSTRSGSFVQYRFAPVCFERVVPFPIGHVLVVASSGVEAAKTGTALAHYNRVAERLHEALAGRRDESSLQRLEQFRVESDEIVPAAGDALADGDLARLGALVDRSQANAERLLGNQVPETIALARSARELGAVAASAFGAGFGGSVYALVRENESAEFTRRWFEAYRKRFPARSPTFFASRAGPSARRLWPSSD